MGGCKGKTEPAFQTFVTGIYAPTAEGGVLFAALPSAFSFCTHPCKDRKNVGTTLSEMNLLRS